MKKYRVAITATARQAIDDQVAYIAEECLAPVNAAKWLGRVIQVIDGLSTLPTRFPFAEENAHRDYEVRRAIVGSHLLLFTINRRSRIVYIIGLRHGHRLPRPGDLPPTAP